MTVSTTKMTARQFLQLGEDPPGVRLELVNGEIAVSPSPSPQHSYAVFALSTLLKVFIDEHALGQLFGDVDTIFGSHDVRRPDLLYFQKSRLHLIGDNAMEGPPDLAVEVISPSSSTIDRKDKFDQYRKGGVANYWILDTKRKTFEGYALKRGKYAATGQASGSGTIQLPPFPELSIPLAKLWRPTK